MLSKKYKLKQTGIIVEHKAGEVSFLGRRVFRTKECQGTNVIFFGLSPEYLDSCCEESQITKGTDKLPSLERLVKEFEKKGKSEKLSPEAHDRCRRVLGKLAWASLTRPDLAFVTGFLGRFQAGFRACDACYFAVAPQPSPSCSTFSFRALYSERV